MALSKVSVTCQFISTLVSQCKSVFSPFFCVVNRIYGGSSREKGEGGGERGREGGEVWVVHEDLNVIFWFFSTRHVFFLCFLSLMIFFFLWDH